MHHLGPISGSPFSTFFRMLFQIFFLKGGSGPRTNLCYIISSIMLSDTEERYRVGKWMGYKTQQTVVCPKQIFHSSFLGCNLMEKKKITNNQEKQNKKENNVWIFYRLHHGSPTEWEFGVVSMTVKLAIHFFHSPMPLCNLSPRRKKLAVLRSQQRQQTC